MSIFNEVPGLPFKAGRHLAAWIVWHAVRVSMLDDEPSAPTRSQGRKRSKSRTKK
jgi:hypothetical protein